MSKQTGFLGALRSYLIKGYSTAWPMKDSSITVVSGGHNPICDYIKMILDQAQ